MERVEVRERLLVEIWRRQFVDPRNLITDSGLRLQVVHPGTQNTDRGPDFVDAILATGGGELLRGDVELHSRASDWRRHGHHLDSNYNGLILQIVWDGDETAELENGRMVPTLRLCHALNGSLDDVRRWAELPLMPGDPCRGAGLILGWGRVGNCLDEAGEERFRAKAERFACRIGDEPPSEVVYQGLMAALGYAKNKSAFEELARLLPLAALERYCRGRSQREQTGILQALLLGKAGLLEDGGDGKLGRIWNRLGDGRPMGSSSWRSFRVRPGNHPSRRLMGAAHLLARFMSPGLFEGVLRAVAEAKPGARELESSFIVFGSRSGLSGRGALVGQGRAREIVVNVALPFAFAWAQVSLQRDLADHVLALFRGCPRSEENGAVRRLAELVSGAGASAVVNSARRQQGLLHLTNNYCRRRGCDQCPLSTTARSGASAS